MDAYIIYSDSAGQVLTDNIKLNGRPLDLTTATVTFKMRPLNDTTLKVNEPATIENPERGGVSYAWQPTDVNAQGEYRAWWNVEISDGTFDTEEFEIIVSTHGPGLITTTGAFYRHAKSHFPVTWKHLEDALGDGVLQNEIEVVKKTVFNDDISVADEEDFDIRVQSYVGKLIAIQIIPRAVDYWMNQPYNVSATGTNENVTYPDRVEGLWKLYERLLKEVTKDKPLIEDIIGVSTLTPSGATPGVSLGTDENFVTPLPQKDTYRPYHFPERDWVAW